MVIFEIFTIIPHVIIGNYSWPLTTTALVLIAWLVELLVFALIYSFKSDFSEGKKCSIVFLNQIIPVMEDELKISVKKNDQKKSVRLQHHLTVFKVIRMLMKLSLAVVSFYYLANTLGMQSICLPKVFSNHWQQIDFQSHNKPHFWKS